jgi:hypothetical protein
MRTFPPAAYHIQAMARPPKRLPGERNPVPDAEPPRHVARESWMDGHDYGIARAVFALLDLRRRRKARTGRSAL